VAFKTNGMDAGGRPSFNALQNRGPASPLFYDVLDVIVAGSVNVMGRPLEARREILCVQVLSLLADPIRESPELEASLADLVQSVKAQGLEVWLPTGATARMSLGNVLAHGRRCA
jgi:ATP-dependent DNA ligase